MLFAWNKTRFFGDGLEPAARGTHVRADAAFGGRRNPDARTLVGQPVIITNEVRYPFRRPLEVKVLSPTMSRRLRIPAISPTDGPTPFIATLLFSG
jgi:hypothetical protein